MASNSAKSIGSRLRFARKSAGFNTARDFAQRHEIPESTYSQRETGKRPLSIEHVIEYSQVLGVDAGWLLTGKGEARSSQPRVVSDATEAPATVTPLEREIMRERVSMVNMPLFCDILEQILTISNDPEVELTDAELIEFAVDIYNSIVTTSADDPSRQAMIRLSVTSLKRGIKRDAALIPQQEIAY